MQILNFLISFLKERPSGIWFRETTTNKKDPVVCWTKIVEKMSFAVVAMQTITTVLFYVYTVFVCVTCELIMGIIILDLVMFRNIYVYFQLMLLRSCMQDNRRVWRNPERAFRILWWRPMLPCWIHDQEFYKFVWSKPICQFSWYCFY